MKKPWSHYRLSMVRSRELLDMIVPLPRSNTRNRSSRFDWMQPVVCQFLEKTHKKEQPPTVREIQRFLAARFGDRGKIQVSTLHRRLSVWKLNLFLVRRK